MLKVKLLLLLHLALVVVVPAEYVPITRSPVNLDLWTGAEILFFERLTNLTESHEDDQVKRYLQDFRSSHHTLRGYNPQGSVESRVSAIASNPLATYRMLRRIVFDLLPLKQILSSPDLFSSFPSESWLSTGDLLDAVLGILRICQVYHLQPQQVADGIIGEVDTGIKLNSYHCYEVGWRAYEKGFYPLSIEWFEVAVSKSKQDFAVQEGLVLEWLAHAVEDHDKNFTSRWHLDPHFYDQKLIPLLLSGRFGERKRQREILELKYGGTMNEHFHNDINFGLLCTQGSIQSPEERSKLFCWLESRINKYWILGPLKMEFLARDPDVVQLYDVIGETRIEELQREVKNSLQMSTVVDVSPEAPGGSTVSSSIRTSVNGWIREELHEDLRVIPVAIERMTGLEVVPKSASDDLQVASYTFGGHYDVHLDALMTKGFEVEVEGDRIGTFLYYLEEPEMGGETAFPAAKVAARPVKGSAVFWYGLHTDGSADQSTYHGACPVVLGRKWGRAICKYCMGRYRRAAFPLLFACREYASVKSNLANKWIRFYDQFLVRKCALDPKERFQFPVNGVLRPLPKLKTAASVAAPTSTVEANNVKKYSFISPRGLFELVKFEWSIYGKVKEVYEKFKLQPMGEDEGHDRIQRYLVDFEETTGRIMNSSEVFGAESVKSVSGNPLAVFRMMWRFAAYIQKWTLESQIVGSAESKGFQEISRYLKGVYNVAAHGPGKEDLDNSIFTLLNIHFIHGYTARNIAEGIIGHVATGIPLSAEHCFEIGRYGVSIEYFTIGIEWLELALSKARDGDKSVPYDLLLKDYTAACQVHDEKFGSTEGWEPKYFDRPLANMSDTSQRRTRKTIQYDYYKKRKEANFVEINYWGVCSGKPHQTEEEKSKLFCWYETEIHPSWKIGPLKAEFHSLGPSSIQVVQYYDVIQGSLAEELQSLNSQNFIASSTIANFDKTDRVVDRFKRLSVQNWINEKHAAAMRASRLIERVTGLRVRGSGSEELQVSAYTSGSHYVVHTDAAGVSQTRTGHRIATFMFYLSDVTEGGDTAFVQAGARVTPKKGSAVFWYNLFTCGELDEQTWHGACPVLFGEKWVANKWINYEPQVALQCGPQPRTPHHILVNGRVSL